MPHVHVCDACSKIWPAPITCEYTGTEDHDDVCNDCHYAMFGDAGILATHALETEWQGIYLPERMNTLTFEQRIKDLLTWIRAAEVAGVVDFPVPPHDLLFESTEQQFQTLIHASTNQPGAGNLCERFCQFILGGDLLPPNAPPERRYVTSIQRHHKGFLYIVDPVCDYVAECLICPDDETYFPLQNILINPTAHLTNPYLQY